MSLTVFEKVLMILEAPSGSMQSTMRAMILSRSDICLFWKEWKPVLLIAFRGECRRLPPAMENSTQHWQSTASLRQRFKNGHDVHLDLTIISAVFVFSVDLYIIA